MPLAADQITKRVHRLLKQERIDDLALAEAFLRRKPHRPAPEWYAVLLEEHGREIAIVIALWLASIRERLARLPFDDWGSSLLWLGFEESLALSLAPVLRRAASSAMRRQAVEAGEPVPLRYGDFEIAEWAGLEATAQAQFIAFETRAAIEESLRTLLERGFIDNQVRSFILNTGLYGLNRRFAASVLRRALEVGVEFADALKIATKSSNELLAVRGEMIVNGNAVDAVHVGMALAALLWSQDNKIVYKTWIAQQDELTCEICRSLHMQTVRRDVAFVAYDGSMYERPKAHLNCRCFVEYRVRSMDEGLIDLFDFV